MTSRNNRHAGDDVGFFVVGIPHPTQSFLSLEARSWSIQFVLMLLCRRSCDNFLSLPYTPFPPCLLMLLMYGNLCQLMLIYVNIHSLGDNSGTTYLFSGTLNSSAAAAF